MTRANRTSAFVLAIAYLLAGTFIVRPLLAASTTDPSHNDPSRPTEEQPTAFAPVPAPTFALAAPADLTATPLFGPSPAPGASPTPTPVPKPVHVLRTYPIDADYDVLPQAPLRIVFDQAMDTDPAAFAFAISPNVPLEMEWQGPDALLLRGQAWERGTLYEFTLQAARSVNGGALDRPLWLEFMCGGYGAPIPILMYHHIDALEPPIDAATAAWTVSPMQFVSEMDLLAGLGAHVVALAEAVDYLTEGRPLPSRPAVLTFDDDNRCVYERAVPLLEERGLAATFFVPASYPGSGAPSAMDWDQLKDLVKAGFTLGAHSYWHDYVHRLTPDQAEREIGKARWDLEKETGAEVAFFAYPYGYYSDRTIEQLRWYGYRAGLTIDPTVYQHPGGAFILSRIRTEYGEPLESFQDKLPWE